CKTSCLTSGFLGQHTLGNLDPSGFWVLHIFWWGLKRAGWGVVVTMGGEWPSHGRRPSLPSARVPRETCGAAKREKAKFESSNADRWLNSSRLEGVEAKGS